MGLAPQPNKQAGKTRGKDFKSNAPKTNLKPVIGVVSQAITPDLKEAYPEIAADYRSFIQADIVHFLNGSGARVVPIIDTESDSETASKLV